MIIYVLDDGETWTLSEPTAVAITLEQLDRIEGGEKFYHVVPDWDERPEPPCNCVRCTTERTASRNIVAAQNTMEPNDYALCVHCGASHHIGDGHQCEEDDFFINAGIAAREALKAKARGEEE